MLVLPQAALSHMLSLNATNHTPKFSKRMGAYSTVYFGFGHRFPVQDFLPKEMLTEFKLIGPDGQANDLTPGEGGYLTTSLRMKKEGTYTVAATTTPGIYTMYLKNGKIHHKMGSMEGLENIVLSMYYEQCAKALISAGISGANDYSRIAGHNIEIVLLENPFKLSQGDRLKVKVVHKGKPAPYCNVYGTYDGFSSKGDYAFTTTTDSDGIAEIRLLHYGPWLLKAVVNNPVSENLKKKCLTENYTATLRFEIP